MEPTSYSIDLQDCTLQCMAKNAGRVCCGCGWTAEEGGACAVNGKWGAVNDL